MSEVVLQDGRTVKLGRIRPKSRPNALRFASYLAGAVANLPESVDYTAKAKQAIAQMYLNDQYGDCVIAGKGHAVGLWSGNESGTPVIATDHEIYSAYQTICGPGDNGCNIAAVLDYMKSNGITLGGQNHKIDGYVAVDWTNQDEVKTALYLFGTLTLGINLPSAWANTQDGGIWDMTNTRIVGGHDVECAGYNDQGVVICTWGGLRTITWQAFTSKYYLDECYALLSPDWYSKDNLAPIGLNVQQLKDDLEKLGGGTIPPIDPPAPTPGPSPDPGPSPVPVPPTPKAPTLDDAITAVIAGIQKGMPYEGPNVIYLVQDAAIQALGDLWSEAQHR